MKNKTLLLGLAHLTLACSITAQSLSEQQEEKFVAVPAEQVLMTIVSQPGCSLQFENVRFLESIQGGGSTPSFIVRNNGSKPIREFTVGGPDWTMSWSETFTKKLLMPGETAFEGNSDIQIVPLTDKLKEALKLGGPMRAVLVVMVVNVKFADGTTYEAGPIHQALQKYSERLIGAKPK